MRNVAPRPPPCPIDHGPTPRAAAILAVVTWQWIAVAVIEALAVGFLVWRLVGSNQTPKILQKPDVKASDLVRKKKPS